MPVGIIIAAVLSALVASAQASVFKTLPYYDNLRQSTTSLQRQGILDAVVHQDSDNESENLRLCHLVDLNIFSATNRSGIKVHVLRALEDTAAVSLALEHLNSGNGSIVREVEGLSNRCSIRFTSEHLDTQRLENEAVDEVIDVLSRSRANTTHRYKPCAFIGSSRSQVSMSTALLTSLKGYPQVSPWSQSGQLDDKGLFPLFGRLLPSNAKFEEPLFDFITNRLKVNHLAVIHTDTVFSMSYLNGARAAAASAGIELRTVGFSDNSVNLTAQVKALKETGYRYFFAIASSPQLQLILEEAHRQDIAGTGEHTWLSSRILSQNLLRKELPKSSAIATAGKGLIGFDLLGALPGVGRYDEFVRAIRELSEDDEAQAYLQNKVPLHPEWYPMYNPVFSTDSFMTGSTARRSSFYFDTTIAIGLAACAAVGNDEELDLDGAIFYRALLNTTFVGVTGTVKFDKDTGSRVVSSANFALQNIVEVPGNTSTETIKLESVHTNYYHDGQWHDANTSIVFNDGGTDPPPDLEILFVNYNYIGGGWRIGGWVMSGIVLLASLGLLFWTHHRNNTQVVKASQPIFLILICSGTLLMGASIIPLSIDDEIAATTAGVDVACMAFPWMLSMGWCVTFSALFTKTRRVVKIFYKPRFRRVTVKAKDVITPMLILLLANALILVLWTVLEPLNWNRTIVNLDEYGRPIETRGYCSSDLVAVYVVPLVVVNLGALLLAIHQAFLARKISVEFAESDWIARAMNSILIVAFVGVPVLVIIQEEPSAYFFVLASVVFAVCMSILGFIFLPKIYTKLNATESPGISMSRFFVPSNGNGFSAPEEVTGHSGEGARVISHPKLVSYLEGEVCRLRSENEKLTLKLVGYEQNSGAEENRVDGPENGGAHCQFQHTDL